METRFEVQFKEIVEAFCLGFEDLHLVNDGGYERGYAEGHDVGFAEGENVGYSRGYSEGFIFGSEDKPTVFAPQILPLWNEVRWSANSGNGSFPVTIEADVDGEAVVSPVIITEQENGKTLNVIASAEHFKSTHETVPLVHRVANPFKTTVLTSGFPAEPPIIQGRQKKWIMDFDYLQQFTDTVILNGQEIKSTSNDSHTDYRLPVTFNTLDEVDFAIKVTTVPTSNKYIRFYFGYEGYTGWNNLSWYGGTYNDVKGRKTTIYVNGEERYTTTSTSVNAYTALGTLNVGDLITFTFSAAM